MNDLDSRAEQQDLNPTSLLSPYSTPPSHATLDRRRDQGSLCQSVPRLVQLLVRGPNQKLIARLSFRRSLDYSVWSPLSTRARQLHRASNCCTSLQTLGGRLTISLLLFHSSLSRSSLATRLPSTSPARGLLSFRARTSFTSSTDRKERSTASDCTRTGASFYRHILTKKSELSRLTTRPVVDSALPRTSLT